VSVRTVESDSLSPIDPRDYRRGNLLGSMMVLFGALLALMLIVTAIGNPPGLHWISVLKMTVIPAVLILIGLLVIGRAKLALWLMYLLTAEFVYSLIREFVHALRTRRSDDIYSALFDACVLSVWLCIAAYFYNRRAMFTGFWGSLETDETQSVDARNHAH
jgi:Ca2+/Na+ antiporter